MVIEKKLSKGINFEQGSIYKRAFELLRFHCPSRNPIYKLV